MTEEHVTISEAAEILSVSERTIWLHIKSGKLTRVKLDGKTCIPLHEVLKAGEGKTEALEYDPAKHVILERSHFEMLLKAQQEALHMATESSYRIGQLEAEKRQDQETIKLLEDRRPWWKRLIR